MRRIILVIALAASAPLQAADTSLPHRAWGKEAILGSSIDDAQACIAREMAKTGTVIQFPRDGGVDIDWTIKGFGAAPKGNPYFTFMLRNRADQVVLTALYRRPMSQKNIEGTVTGLGKRCLTITSIVDVGLTPNPA